MGVKTDLLKFVCQSKGLRYVGGRGNPRSPIWIIGEAPGADEDASGIPFSGYSGKQLDGQLSEVGLSEADIYFTNPYKVRPPDNEFWRRHELGIPENLYLEAFEEELNENKPTFIVCAGAVPLSLLCPYTVSKRDGTPRISSWRGSLLHSDSLGWEHYVIPMYHPAFILREYSERTIAIFCLERVKEEFLYWRDKGRIQPLPQRELIASPSFDDIIAYLEDCFNCPEDTPVSCDVENPFYKFIQIPYAMNFAYSDKHAISFNLWDLSIAQLNTVMRSMDKVLRSKRLVGQNFINYDATLLEESCGFRPRLDKLDDTMTRHKVLWPEFEHTLQFQTVQYTREPYYKDEGHEWNADTKKMQYRTDKQLRVYGCKDAAVTWEVWASQEAELDGRNLRSFYETIEMPGARNFHCIQNRGILVDTAKLSGLRQKIVKHLEKLCQDAMQFTKCATFFDGDTAKDFQRFAKTSSNGTIKKQGDVPVFNLGSTKQIIELFDRLGIYLPSENFKKKTDEEAMQKAFAKTGHRMPQIILESRGLNKLKGTNVDAVLRSNILYTNYITTGTVNGRRSSSMLWEDTPFVYGANTQNLPKHGKGVIGDYQKEYRECLIARPGKIFLACDQVQAEDWIVQGIIKDQGGSPQGFEELLTGVDRHRKLATVIFKKTWDECHKESHERFLGKKTRHAGNYDMGGFRFAVVLAKEGFHVAEEYCNLLLVSFHQYDPGIRGVFHKYVQTKLEDCRQLVNPFGRTRIFFGLHPSRDNTKIFKEAYSTLPQSTVSDNTLQAVNIIEDEAPGQIIKEDHDAITMEIPDTPSAIMDGILLFDKAFDREIRLEKGLAFRIPIEYEIGYNLAPLKTRMPDGSIKITPGGMRGINKNDFESVREEIKESLVKKEITCLA